MLRKVASAIAAVAFLTQSATAQTTAVDIELKLLIDVSGSVNDTEYNLQKTGYVNAFNNGPLWTTFAASNRTLAVSYSEWSSSALLRTSWFQVTNAATAGAFATAISGLSRATGVGNSTYVGTAINFGVAALNSNSFTGTRRIIDISGDGCSNGGDSPATATANAALGSITINGLAIGGAANLAACYGTYRTTDGFVETAASFIDFDDALVRKLGRELVIPVPEPSTVALLGLGLFGLAFTSRRRRA